MVADISLELSAAVFLDTSLVVAATVEAHPSHAATAAFVDDLASQGGPLLAVRVLDDDLWGQIKSGELTGLSIGSAAHVSEPPAAALALALARDCAVRSVACT